MIHNVEDHFMDRPHLVQSLKDDEEKLLYVGCSKFTKLSAVLRLYNLKEENGWSNKSFTTLLIILKDMLPEANELSDRTYDAKKILYSMGMNYERYMLTLIIVFCIERVMKVWRDVQFMKWIGTRKIRIKFQ